MLYTYKSLQESTFKISYIPINTKTTNLEIFERSYTHIHKAITRCREMFML